MIVCEWLVEGVKKASRQATGQMALIGLPVSYLSHLTVMYRNVKCLAFLQQIKLKEVALLFVHRLVL